MTEREFLFSKALIALLREVVVKGESSVWNTVTERRGEIGDYVAKLGLYLVVDEDNGYAYLRQEEESGLPKLMRRTPLTFHQSLLLVMLRNEINEFDAANGDSYLVVEKTRILSYMRRYYGQITDEVKFENKINSLINRAIEMKFIEPVEGGEEAYEVKPILRSFIDADWLSQFNEALKAYNAQNQMAEAGPDMTKDGEGDD